MSRKVRIVLYILSIAAVAGLIAAGNGQGMQETMRAEAVSEENLDKTNVDDEPSGQNDAEGLTSTEHASDGLAPAENAPDKVAGTEAAVPSGEDGKNRQDPAAEDTEADETAQTDGGETTILFTGDVLFANAFTAAYDAHGIGGVVGEELLEELKGADILMVNNEFPYSDRGTPMADKQFTFRCSPSYVKALNEMGVDVVSLANNHTLDYGKEALSDTFAALDGAGILYGGAGETAERAEEVQVIEVNGKKYGFLAVSRVIPTADWKVENSAPGIFSCYDDTRLVELVKEAKEECDFLAVYPHWGVEYQAYPEEYQTRIARRCIEAGADVIVGCHTHCLQGVSYIEGKPVFFSLGNFIFGQNIDRSAVLKVTVDEAGNASYQLLPVCASGGMTYFAEGEQAAQTLTYLDSISDASVGADGTVTQ